jgi:RimJ/RimL family protein N-acetyltransferase
MSGHPWPIFDLVIRTSGLELRLPSEDELVQLLELAKAGIHPPEEMPFGFAWTDMPSPQFERNFMQYHWSTRAGWKPDDWTFDLAVWLDGRLVGTQGLRGQQFPVMRTVGTGSWLARAYQRQGIGREMRSAILAFAFDHLGAERATSEVFVDNPRSIGVSRALGYQENGRTWLAPRGVVREEIRFLMTAEMWRSRERPGIVVQGLDGCRDLFGIAR